MRRPNRMVKFKFKFSYEIFINKFAGGTKKKNAVMAVNESKAGGKKSVTRREELLKQLKAVEDAIRRKKTKPA